MHIENSYQMWVSAKQHDVIFDPRTLFYECDIAAAFPNGHEKKSYWRRSGILRYTADVSAAPFGHIPCASFFDFFCLDVYLFLNRTLQHVKALVLARDLTSILQRVVFVGFEDDPIGKREVDSIFLRAMHSLQFNNRKCDNGWHVIDCLLNRSLDRYYSFRGTEF